MRKLAVAVVVIGTLMVSSVGVATAAPPVRAAASTSFPDTIALPDGFRPEGISIGRGTSFYVGSLNDGAIYRGDVKTGAGAILVPGQAGLIAAGTEVDQRNRLFVAGGPTGAARIYDAKTGALVASYQLAPAGTSFINDVVVTRDAAYFTDSLNQVLYVVPFGQGGVPAATAQTLPLTGDIVYGPEFNANGIEASPDGRTLLVIQSNKGLLFAVDAATGVATQVDLGGASLTFGDGLLLYRSTLYVVRNRLNLIAEIDLDRTYRTGVVTGGLTSAGFDVPTTVAAFGSSLYAVNARFGTPPTPTTDYAVIRVSTRS